jgi:DNA-binding IclR family transcriptional regulator
MSTKEMTRRGENAGAEPTTGVPAVLKCIAILRLLDDRGAAGMSLSAIASALGQTKSHCLNIMRTLFAEKWVRHDTERRTYVLDTGLLDDISNLLARQDRSGRLHEVLVNLTRAVRIPSILTRINPDDSFIAVDKSEEGAELFISVPIGHRFPWDAPAQLRARLSRCEPDVAAALIARWEPRAFTSKSAINRQQLLDEVEATRARGYAVSRSEFTWGIMSLAVPVFDPAGRMRMILQCPGVEADIERREAEVAAAILKAADQLSALL